MSLIDFIFFAHATLRCQLAQRVLFEFGNFSMFACLCSSLAWRGVAKVLLVNVLLMNDSSQIWFVLLGRPWRVSPGRHL